MKTTLFIISALFVFKVGFCENDRNNQFIDSGIINGVYWIYFISLDERKSLLAEESIWVDPSSLLRSPDVFTHKVGEGVQLKDFVSYIAKNYDNEIGPNQLVIVVVKRDSIKRFYLKHENIDMIETIEYEIYPGDVVLLGLR